MKAKQEQPALEVPLPSSARELVHVLQAHFGAWYRDLPDGQGGVKRTSLADMSEMDVYESLRSLVYDLVDRAVTNRRGLEPTQWEMYDKGGLQQIG